MAIILSSSAAAQTVAGEWFWVKTGPAAILLNPTSSSVVVASVPAGTRVRVQKRQDEWYLVAVPQMAGERAPVSGWVPAVMLSSEELEMPSVESPGRLSPHIEPVRVAEPTSGRPGGVTTRRDLPLTQDRAQTVSRTDNAHSAKEGVIVSDTAAVAAQAPVIEYRVLATNKTSTMQKEMQEAAEAGFRFGAVMGGDTVFGGSEVVVVMHRGGSPGRFAYRLLATSKTSTMQKEMQEAGDAGFEYRGQTVFKSAFGGKEVVAILERPDVTTPIKYEYRLLASKKTSTMQKELAEAGEQAFEFVGVTVAKTLIGGDEVVTILRRKL
jgi:hypothetical protein